MTPLTEAALEELSRLEREATRTQERFATECSDANQCDAIVAMKRYGNSVISAAPALIAMARRCTDLEREAQPLKNLLARVCGDGGHRAEEIGIVAAVEEAQAKFTALELRASTSELREREWAGELAHAEKGCEILRVLTSAIDAGGSEFIASPKTFKSIDEWLAADKARPRRMTETCAACGSPRGVMCRRDCSGLAPAPSGKAT